MEISELHNELEKHAQDDQRVQGEIKEKLDKILDNHLSHMETDLAVLSQKTIALAEKTDSLWTAARWVITIVLGAVILALLKLVILP